MHLGNWKLSPTGTCVLCPSACYQWVCRMAESERVNDFGFSFSQTSHT